MKKSRGPEEFYLWNSATVCQRGCQTQTVMNCQTSFFVVGIGPSLELLLALHQLPAFSTAPKMSSSKGLLDLLITCPLGLFLLSSDHCSVVTVASETLLCTASCLQVGWLSCMFRIIHLFFWGGGLSSWLISSTLFLKVDSVILGFAGWRF